MKIIHVFLKFIVVKMHNEDKNNQKIRKEIESICNITDDSTKELKVRHWNTLCLIEKKLGTRRFYAWIGNEVKLSERVPTKEDLWKITIKDMKEELLQNALNPKRIKGILWKEEK